MRLRFDREDDLRSAMWTILEENSTPIVCEERTRHSSRTKRWRRHDLRGRVNSLLGFVGLSVLTSLRRWVQAALSSLGNHTCSPAPARGQWTVCCVARAHTYADIGLTTLRRGDGRSPIPPHPDVLPCVCRDPTVDGREQSNCGRLAGASEGQGPVSSSYGRAAAALLYLIRAAWLITDASGRQWIRANRGSQRSRE